MVRYKGGLSAQFSGFKVATSTLVLSIPDDYRTSHMPQAAHAFVSKTTDIGFEKCKIVVCLWQSSLLATNYL